MTAIDCVADASARTTRKSFILVVKLNVCNINANKTDFVTKQSFEIA